MVEATKRDDWRITMEKLPPCFYCVHCIKTGTQDLHDGGYLCSAYPKGIPVAILARMQDHEEHIPGQEGEDVYESKVMPFPEGPCIVTFDGEWLLVRPDGTFEEVFPDEEEEPVDVPEDLGEME